MTQTAKTTPQRRTPKRRRSKTPMRVAILATAGALLLVTGIGALLTWRYASTPYTGSEPVRITIPAGSTPEAVDDSLSAAVGPKMARRVMTVIAFFNDKAAQVSGSYVARPGMTALALGRNIALKRQTPVKASFIGVRRMADMAERMTRRLAITPDELLEAIDSIGKSRGVDTENLPTLVVPDTYEFYYDASARTVAETLVSYRDRFWRGDRTERARALELSAEQVATLASIVEEETAKADERPLVARLYLNRLKRGMKLQADPTVKYAVGDPTLRRIGEKHLSARSPYNTYLYAGLPPGPIRVAEGSAIDAVLNAPAHDYLYMCAREDFSGYHNFASDYTAHQANAARYHRALDSRGISLKQTEQSKD